MIRGEIKGAIFDVDDTLLDNFSAQFGKGLHERSRLAAVHEVGRLHELPTLLAITEQDNHDAFHTAVNHSIEAAAWNILIMAGIVEPGDIRSDHALLREIVALKDELHAPTLLAEGREIKDASRFIRGLASIGLSEHLAIASSATRRDIDTFLGMVSLTDLFDDSRIQSRESVTHFKPHPEAFDNAFRALRLEESDRGSTLAFEDDPRGITSARRAGLYVCAITTRFDKDAFAKLDDAPDLIADSYQEFSELLGTPLVP